MNYKERTLFVRNTFRSIVNTFHLTPRALHWLLVAANKLASTKTSASKEYATLVETLRQPEDAYYDLDTEIDAIKFSRVGITTAFAVFENVAEWVRTKGEGLSAADRMVFVCSLLGALDETGTAYRNAIETAPPHDFVTICAFTKFAEMMEKRETLQGERDTAADWPLFFDDNAQSSTAAQGAASKTIADPRARMVFHLKELHKAHEDLQRIRVVLDSTETVKGVTVGYNELSRIFNTHRELCEQIRSGSLIRPVYKDDEITGLLEQFNQPALVVTVTAEQKALLAEIISDFWVSVPARVEKQLRTKSGEYLCEVLKMIGGLKGPELPKLPTKE